MQFIESSNKIEGIYTSDEWFYDMLADGYSLDDKHNKVNKIGDFQIE